jgi:hypothetical protein
MKYLFVLKEEALFALLLCHSCARCLARKTEVQREVERQSYQSFSHCLSTDVMKNMAAFSQFLDPCLAASLNPNLIQLGNPALSSLLPWEHLRIPTSAVPGSEP